MRIFLTALLIFAALPTQAAYTMFGATTTHPIAVAWGKDGKTATILTAEPCVRGGKVMPDWARVVFVSAKENPVEGCFTQDEETGVLNFIAFVPGAKTPLRGHRPPDGFSKVTPV